MSTSRRIPLLLTVSLLAACVSQPRVASLPPASPPVTAATTAAPLAAVPVAQLVGQIAIPHSLFRLANGLTVLVHEDRKAPIVAVSTWYNVGSKDEPPGKTGFAHLFEHLMYNGSENLPGDFFTYLEQIGATDYNGTTWFDRTNYFQNVPRGGLERALFMESDRMGYLLGALTQQKLDNQRAVVQNEKRQGDNQPGGLVDYEVLAALFPEGHPYHHDTIGSMADLDAASLADVKRWFLDHYGPNNAVLVLAGDIGAAEARPLVEKYFGAIAPGKVNQPAAATVPTLAQPKSIVMKDRVAAVQVQRHWAVPGLLSDELAALDLGGAILGGLASSRLDRALVRDEKVAVSVSAGLQPFQRVGLFTVEATVRPGVDPALVEKRLNELLAQFIAEGPTRDEVIRAATSDVAARIRGLEQVGGRNGKAVTLAEGQVYAGDGDFYRRTLRQYGAVEPADIRTVMAQWLGRPALSLRLEPGERPPYVEAKGAKPAKGQDIVTKKTVRTIPPVTATPALDFSTVEHAILSNGIKVAYARREAVPLTQLALSFDAGFSADAPGERGLQSLTLGLLDEGTERLSSQAIAEAQERLGAIIAAAGGADRSSVTLSALTANMAPSLDLLTEIVQRPAFAPAEIERVRAQVLTAIAQAQKEPNAIAARALPALLYGADHPYATTAIGDVSAVTRFARDDLVRFHQQWLRPDNLEIFAVSDLPLAQLLPQLEARFGRWAAPATPRGSKLFPAALARPTKPRVVLIDRPGSPQSVILGGQLTPIDPMGDIVAVGSANDILGGSFLSRLNMDLRETKGWSYGVQGAIGLNVHSARYLISAPVQGDRTGESIAALSRDLRDMLGTQGVTAEELERTVTNNIASLPGRFETSAAVLAAMQSNALYGRPDNYYELLADKYRGLTRASLDQALRSAIDPNGFVWVVVGDAAKVRPQLGRLGMPIEVIEPR